ncbi:CDP-alcohol phosphatidyltransferase family protein [Candidatus Peregrinibacteria bacterium]|nr:CDP-alcohol phosphatidyltransferase family protein [Candidatus Peregrinibacteria bacterium]
MKKSLSSSLYTAIKPYRDRYLGFFADKMIGLRITANMVSYFRLFLYLPIFWSFGVNLWITFCLVILSFLLDALDGLIARKTRTTSLFGEKLDFLIDKLQLLPVVAGIVFYSYAGWFWAFLYLCEFLLSLFLIFIKNKTFNYSRFLLYFSILFYCIWSVNIIDVVLVFLSFYQLVILIKHFIDTYD